MMDNCSFSSKGHLRDNPLAQVVIALRVQTLGEMRFFSSWFLQNSGKGNDMCKFAKWEEYCDNVL